MVTLIQALAYELDRYVILVFTPKVVDDKGVVVQITCHVDRVIYIVLILNHGLLTNVCLRICSFDRWIRYAITSVAMH